MSHRIATWLIVIWTGGMALGILAAFLGIGGDCIGLAGSAFNACQADAWARGLVGLALLGFLWGVVFLALARAWSATRPRVQGPGGAAAR